MMTRLCSLGTSLATHGFIRSAAVSNGVGVLYGYLNLFRHHTRKRCRERQNRDQHCAQKNHEGQIGKLPARSKPHKCICL